MRRTLYFERMFPEMISRPDVGAFIHRATLQVTSAPSLIGRFEVSVRCVSHSFFLDAS